jgi:hypothetical protein
MALYAFIQAVVPLVVAVATLMSVWGLLMYLLNKGDREKRGDGINIIISGALIVFFAVIAWGIIKWIASAL